jgi:hypothetical protein
MLKKTMVPLNKNVLRSLQDSDFIHNPRALGSADMFSVLSLQAMIAVESVQRYGGLTQKKNDSYGKPRRGHHELAYLQ